MGLDFENLYGSNIFGHTAPRNVAIRIKTVLPIVFYKLENTYYLMINHQKPILYSVFLVGNS
jgi:hypothetical protein